MGDPTPEQLAGNWNQVARRYGEYIDPMTALYAADVLEQARVTDRDRVLDVASGFGAATLLAARIAEEVVAVDFSSEMCAALRERVAGEGAGNVRVHEMDAQSLDLDDDEFDAAVSSFGVMICPDRRSAFSEMARVTRAGGRLATSVWQAPPNNEWLELFMTTVSTALPDVDPPTPPPFMQLADPERFRSEVEAAGWSDVDVVDVTHRAEWEDAGAAWAAIAESNPLFGPLLEQLPAEVARKIRGTFSELIDQRGDAHLSAGAWIASGRA